MSCYYIFYIPVMHSEIVIPKLLQLEGSAWLVGVVRMLQQEIPLHAVSYYYGTASLRMPVS